MDAPCKTCAGVTQSDLCGILLCTLLTRGLYSPLGAAGRRSLHDPVPVLRIAPNLSLEVFALLQRNYECWLISILSAINWIGLGRIFEDSRAAVCVVLWLSSQIVVSVDANYRTDPSTVRSTILLGPLLIMVVACCAYRLIPDSSSPKLPIGILTMESRQTVIFTSSTLVIFLVKRRICEYIGNEFKLATRWIWSLVVTGMSYHASFCTPGCTWFRSSRSSD